jgi:uncharacterized membrane protein YeaQ/YmgE (transglycosylase-associated protein family)
MVVIEQMRTHTVGRLLDASTSWACGLPLTGSGRALPLKLDFHRRNTMGIIIWLVVGGVVGWLASMIMRTDRQQGLLLNVVVGIVGAVIAGWLISPLVGVATINEGISIGSVLVSLLGAMALLAIVNLVRRGSVR